MKARLLQNDGTMFLLFCTGKIELVSPEVAKDFLLHFDNTEYYSGSGKWEHEGVSMETYRGKTIAYVGNDNVLHILNSVLFRSILSHDLPRLLTVKEYAEKHGKKPSIIRRHCLDGLLKGATQMGNRWVIPEDCPYPTFD